MPTSSIQDIVVRRMVHQLVSQRLVERVFNQPLIGNVERGQYVECMVELALSELRPRWSLTDTWASWDLDQPDTGARIEIKQSATVQTWTAPASGRTSPSFDIASRTGYYHGAEWVSVDPPQRFADLYVFAHHHVAEPEVADHRDPNQWKFYVVPERDLPKQKTIRLNPLRKLSGEPVSLDELPQAVEDALQGLPLKADQPHDA